MHGRTQSQAFCPISPEPCKFHYFKSAKTHAFPKASEFFTGDYLTSLILTIIGAVVLVWSYLTADGPAKTSAYRITVEVDTPQGVRVGSSIRELTTRAQFGSNGRSLGSELSGEAVGIDLPGSKTLFVLLRGELLEQGEYNALMVLAARTGQGKLWGSRPVEVFPSYFRTVPKTFDPLRDRMPSAEEYRPMLVAFTDGSRRDSAYRVDPLNLEVAFGKGVRLKRITVQLVGKEFEETICRSLPWLSTNKDRPASPFGHDPVDPDFSRTLQGSDFVSFSKEYRELHRLSWEQLCPTV